MDGAKEDVKLVGVGGEDAARMKADDCSLQVDQNASFWFVCTQHMWRSKPEPKQIVEIISCANMLPAAYH